MKKLTILFSMMMILGAFCLSVQAQTSGFAYQGRFTDSTLPQPTNGTYAMQFALFDAATGGTQIGTTVTNPTVQVVNGIFTVNLDFGMNSFDGAARFLEITISNVVLSPRQPVTSSPYSIRSLFATTATNSLQLGGIMANQFVQTNDTRLSDERTPTAGSNNYLQNQNATVQAANFRISGSGIMSGPLTALNIITNNISAPGTINTNLLNTNSITASGEISANGGLRVSGNFVAGGGMRLGGSVTTNGGLEVGENVILNGSQIRLRNNTDTHHAIFYDQSIDGIRFDAFREFQWVRSDSNAELMHLYNNGVLRAAGFNGRCVPLFAGNGVCNQDLAETFRTKEQTEPGDVVTIIPEENELPTVRRSVRGYDEHLVGVVSTSPGLVFDEGETHLAGENDHYITKEKTVVAAVGRVPVKFTTENGAINVGDSLTSSATEPGKAMKATGAGKIIGIALESSEKAQDGKLLVWIQVGYYAPAQQPDKQIEEQNRLIKSQEEKLNGQETQLQRLQTRIEAQEVLLDDLKKIVCGSNPQAEVCKEEK